MESVSAFVIFILRRCRDLANNATGILIHVILNLKWTELDEKFSYIFCSICTYRYDVL